jgi:Mrp family chromosome partitioning ATPase
MSLIDRALIEAYHRRQSAGVSTPVRPVALATRSTTLRPAARPALLPVELEPAKPQTEIEPAHPVQPRPHANFKARVAATTGSSKAKTPLSHFTVGRRQSASLWTPLVALRKFTWSPEVIQLAETDGDVLLGALATAKSSNGIVAIAATQMAAGATTSALAAARFAMSTGQRVALIDAATPNPRLAESLGILSGPTLVSAARNNRSVAEAAIFSVEDNISLVVVGPLARMEVGGEEDEAETARKAITEIATHHDLTIVDLGRLTAAGWPTLAGELVLIHRPATGETALDHAACAAADYNLAGVIEVGGKVTGDR